MTINIIEDSIAIKPHIAWKQIISSTEYKDIFRNIIPRNSVFSRKGSLKILRASDTSVTINCTGEILGFVDGKFFKLQSTEVALPDKGNIPSGGYAVGYTILNDKSSGIESIKLAFADGPDTNFLPIFSIEKSDTGEIILKDKVEVDGGTGGIGGGSGGGELPGAGVSLDDILSVLFEDGSIMKTGDGIEMIQEDGNIKISLDGDVYFYKDGEFYKLKESIVKLPPKESFPDQGMSLDLEVSVDGVTGEKSLDFVLKEGISDSGLSLAELTIDETGNITVKETIDYSSGGGQGSGGGSLPEGVMGVIVSTEEIPVKDRKTNCLYFMSREVESSIDRPLDPDKYYISPNIGLEKVKEK